jgi:rhodanese-related sulfurtransferase
LIVDIRATDARARDGVVPGSVHVPRTVLEWRADPDSGVANPYLAGRTLVLLCDHGQSSSLAAATLVELGHTDVADVVGGFEAWVAEGLPTTIATSVPDTELPGSGPPD